ncbi:probable aspartic protease At2g35615 [Chenopodium quinoa]|uniref:probable aspartic protease At2g35615 n=1 Tax=Chenopodium quinoa TaxID=63459 RepID=UPI000B778FC6|nr:probable aspartic protease At2g35615 [Chenopodium quinoa]
MIFVFLNMFTKTFLSTIFLVVSLASASSPSKGLTAPLIPPTSPRSPFYTEILKANNISTTKNVTLNRSQYMEWLITKYTQNKQGEVSFQRDAGHHVVDMYLGNPEQRVYGIFDTSSDIVWIQCAKQAKQNEFVYYNYSESSTYKHVPCDDVKCNTSYVNIIGCKGKLPPCAFMATYENATVAYGPLATDVVTFKPESEIVQDFIFGCSVKNSPRMMGAIGEF